MNDSAGRVEGKKLWKRYIQNEENGEKVVDNGYSDRCTFEAPLKLLKMRKMSGIVYNSNHCKDRYFSGVRQVILRMKLTQTNSQFKKAFSGAQMRRT